MCVISATIDHILYVCWFCRFSRKIVEYFSFSFRFSILVSCGGKLTSLEDSIFHSFVKYSIVLNTYRCCCWHWCYWCCCCCSLLYITLEFDMWQMLSGLQKKLYDNFDISIFHLPDRAAMHLLWLVFWFYIRFSYTIFIYTQTQEYDIPKENKIPRFDLIP